MFDATAPPKDEDVTYVGAWFDDHRGEECYERDRWEPFVRCVLSWVGQEVAWRRHPRPLFEGTSFASSIWGSRFRRRHVDGLFVEVPRPLSSRVVEALQTSLSIRGLLEVEQLDAPRFFGHSLSTHTWLVGDVCVRLDAPEGSEWGDDTGLRFACPRQDEADALPLGSRPDAEALLAEIVGRGVREPKGIAVQRSDARAPVETIVLRTEFDVWDGQPTTPRRPRPVRYGEASGRF